jgi:hypothetical protein
MNSGNIFVINLGDNMMYRKKYKMEFFLIYFLLSFSSAQAALFQGNSLGFFTNPVGPPRMVTSGVGTNHFTSGTPFDGASSPSALDFVGTSFDINESDIFTFGTLSSFNGTINTGTTADMVDLSVVLDFAEPSGITASFMYDLSLVNTINSSDSVESADIVRFDNTLPTTLFSSNGTNYTLEFLGFGTGSEGSFIIGDSFSVLEEQSASVDLVGRITVVPIPGAVWFFGSSLIGLLGLSKRCSIYST